MTEYLVQYQDPNGAWGEALDYQAYATREEAERTARWLRREGNGARVIERPVANEE